MQGTEGFMEEELAFELGFGNRQLGGRAHLRVHSENSSAHARQHVHSRNHRQKHTCGITGLAAIIKIYHVVTFLIL